MRKTPVTPPMSLKQIYSLSSSL